MTTQFIKHEVKNENDWSEWVDPDADSYLMKCCDCGLVHELQFRVAVYADSVTEECTQLTDPNTHAQFRARRHNTEESLK